ncbi:DNA-processing protein DprA [Niabella beijingensis]|uniref:DNA-processing protein DprA n=1 Tax=Niabella beijingensis TaxID=2872700 RepID=UPI001CBCDD6D|nr:DNA-processing protein DprA [Niabella beijingensis]MBZ4190733.1 DNA-protecting protein DprA [Niabella beijingensis]
MISVNDILFYSFLTGYNVGEINKIIRLGEGGVEEYVKSKDASGIKISDIQIFNCRKNAEEKYQEMMYFGIKFIPFNSELYPKELKRIPAPPPMIYLKGELKDDHSKNIAIVGSRNVSKYAEESIKEFISQISERKVCIVSGLAYGIDFLAHKYSLKYKVKTIAVLPNALNHIYPKEHLPMANQILDSGGALIAELPIGINLGKRGFVQRNRIQSGLSDFVIPIEMGIASGTMHTIQFAFNQKRKVCVLRPTADQSQLPEYSGIQTLIETNRQKIEIAENLHELSQLIFERSHDTPEIVKPSKPNDHQLKIYNESSSDKESVIIKFTSEISDLSTTLVSSLKKQISDPAYNKTNSKLDFQQFEVDLQVEFQRYLFAFLENFPAIANRELEKILKNQKAKTVGVVKKIFNKSEFSK